MVVALAAGCGLCFTFVGSWYATLISWSARMLGDIAGADLSWALPLALTLLMLGWAAGDILADRKADKGAQFAALVLPTLLVLVVGGTLGHTGGDAVNTAYDQLQAKMTQLGHGGTHTSTHHTGHAGHGSHGSSGGGH
jgi:hypothetical protein